MATAFARICCFTKAKLKSRHSSRTQHRSKWAHISHSARRLTRHASIAKRTLFIEEATQDPYVDGETALKGKLGLIIELRQKMRILSLLSAIVKLASLHAAVKKLDKHCELVWTAAAFSAVACSAFAGGMVTDKPYERMSPLESPKFLSSHGFIAHTKGT